MAIEVIDPEQILWVPVKPGATVYNGGLVTFDQSALTDHGVIQMPVAAGASNTSNLDRPVGSVLGNNLKNKLFDSTTYNTGYVTAVAAGSEHGSTTEFTGVEGSWSKGDSQAMVQIARITGPNTLLKANLWAATVGVAPTVLTVTTGSTDGLSMTTNATQFTPVSSLCTVYCRKGANAGQYRISTNTSTTVWAFTAAFQYDIAIGDQFVAVPLRVGTSYVQTIATSCGWLNVAASPATNYYVVQVWQLDLSVAGQEYAVFSFDGDNFCTARA